MLQTSQRHCYNYVFKCCFVDSKYLTKLFKKLSDPHSIVQHWFCLKLDNNYCVFLLLDLFVCILTIIILGAFRMLLDPIRFRGGGHLAPPEGKLQFQPLNQMILSWINWLFLIHFSFCKSLKKLVVHKMPPLTAWEAFERVRLVGLGDFTRTFHWITVKIKLG